MSRISAYFQTCNNCESVTRLHCHIHYNNNEDSTFLLVTKKGAIEVLEELVLRKDLNSHEASEVTQQVYASSLPEEAEWLEKAREDYLTGMLMFKEGIEKINNAKAPIATMEGQSSMFDMAQPPPKNRFN